MCSYGIRNIRLSARHWRFVRGACAAAKLSSDLTLYQELDALLVQSRVRAMHLMKEHRTSVKGPVTSNLSSVPIPLT